MSKFTIKQPTPAQLAVLFRAKSDWQDSDGTSKKAAATFNALLAPFGECEDLGLFFLPE
jgi:hypothetical protein